MIQAGSISGQVVFADCLEQIDCALCPEALSDEAPGATSFADSLSEKRGTRVNAAIITTSRVRRHRP